MTEPLYRAHVLCCRGTSCSSGGSESIAQALQKLVHERGLESEVKVVITGCHGFCEMGPIMVIYPDDTVYCHVSLEDVPEIVEETLVKGRVVQRLLYRDPLTQTAIPKYHEIPFYGNQERRLLRNCGFINPENIEEYIARDGYTALGKVLGGMTPEQVIETIKAAGLRGRGGAGFPTGLKWEFARKAKGEPKYIICNADEGDPGAFMDRSLIEGDPHALLEGMLIAGYAIGAKEGYIYCRAEYPLAIHRLKIAIQQAHEYGFLGEGIMGTDYHFELYIKEGAGAFVCGEETALIESIQGNRGEPRNRPPYPAVSGLWYKPTNNNNVKSYCSAPMIIRNGPEWFASVGTAKSKGTAIFALTGKINNTGLIEVPMGVTLGEIIYDIGGGITKDRPFKAVQTGGPLGGCLPASQLNTPVDYDSLTEAGATMGSGGMIVVDDTTCMVEFSKFFLTFAVAESCGQCVPCRVGGQRMLETLTRVSQGTGTLEDLEEIRYLARNMNQASICALGQLTPSPTIASLRYFEDEFMAHIVDKRCPAGVCEDLVPAACRNACPAEVNVPVYIRKIMEGDLDGAVAIHRQANPFLSVCGRVCPAFCETRCRRGELDESVAIRQLKRYMIDNLGDRTYQVQRHPDNGKKVAVIGGGPAGLTAALRLGLLGYQVTIFEALPVLGGMMAVGIPDYRLPREQLNAEIDDILQAGNVQVRTNTRVGQDVTMDQLRAEYDAVYVAVGAHKSLRLGVPGEELQGVMHGTDFLRDVNLGADMSAVQGKRVAIVGGGNVAIDVARTAVRLGASEVHIVYRRRREDMPAYAEEIEQADEEGVKMHFLLSPISVAGQNGHVVGLNCQRQKLEEELPDGKKRPVFDNTGRKRPFPIEGAEFMLPVDLVIPAIGQTSDPGCLGGSCKVETTRRGTIVADDHTFVTAEPGVFAGGDAVLGPASIVEAVNTANLAAAAIDRYLRGEPLRTPATVLDRPVGQAKPDMSEEDGSRPRQHPAYAPAESRIYTFDEVERAFDRETAILECRRCLACDLEKKS
ncbi:MAG: FAD-dependent oxidoreductase [Chloroflexi bacterium]|nr:FAD-dependent oxidoreductase [Chloroflexota bacterium]